MTDRYHALTVVLEQDVRDDDAEALIRAIEQLRGVLTCCGEVSDIRVHVAEERARRGIEKKLLAALRSD